MHAVTRSGPAGAYLHIPFCETRCAYCDFNTYADLGDLIPAYVRAMVREIQGVGQAWRAAAATVPSGEPPEVHSVFFGGGTPSLLSVAQIDQTLSTIRGSFELDPEAEITLEANPGTVDLRFLEGIRRAGVNRLSLGVQSARPTELRLLERKHSFTDVIRAVGEIRRAGFTNLNLDLVFGLPSQGLRDWRSSLTHVMELAPDHLSLYPLSLEFGTPMHAWVARGMVPQPDPDLAAEMYAWAGEVLEAAGYVHYEISNWARSFPGQDGRRGYAACRHNLQYWRNQPYLGFGAGAHGWAKGKRYANVLSPRGYVRRMTRGSAFDFPASPAVSDARQVPLSGEMNETMMLGLRMLEEGVDEKAFFGRFGVEVDEVFQDPIRRLQSDGLIERNGGRIRLTRRAYFIANQVFYLFV